jgi:hypothetical protein
MRLQSDRKWSESLSGCLMVITMKMTDITTVGKVKVMFSLY